MLDRQQPVELGPDRVLVHRDEQSRHRVGPGIGVPGGDVGIERLEVGAHGDGDVGPVPTLVRQVKRKAPG